MKKGWEPRQCQHCGEMFEPKSKKTQKFCGPECQQLSRKPKPCVCLYCGETYVPKRSDRDKYCCREHAYAAQKEAAPRRGIEPIIISVCPQCGVHTKYISEYCGDECRAEKNRRKSYRYSRNKHGANAQPQLCKQCGEKFTPEYGSKLRVFCSESCRQKHANKQKQRGGFNQRARRILKKKYGFVVPLMYERIVAKKVYRRDKGICQICKQPIDFEAMCPEPLSASIDHVVPLAKGGTHTYDNVQAAHFQCNWQKGDTTPGAG